jgi:hypothetical protein
MVVNCNPAKSKPCGKSCISLGRTCRIGQSRNTNPNQPRNCKANKSKPCGRSCIRKAYTCRKGVDQPPPTRTQTDRPPPKKYGLKTCRTESKDLKTLPFASTLKDARKAWKKASLACHPDKGGSDADQACVNWHMDTFRSFKGDLDWRQVGKRPGGCEPSKFELHSR